MKKILAIALLCAVSSFAVDTHTWDKFPVKPAGKGELKAGASYVTNGDGNLSLPLGVRYSVIEGLELAAMSGYGVTNEALIRPVVEIRYFMPTGFGGFLSIGIPVEDNDKLFFHFGPQYSTKLNGQLTLGSELGLLKIMDYDPLILNFGAELDYSAGNITPFGGLDFDVGIGDGGKDLDMDATAGVIYKIDAKFTVDGYIVLGGLLREGEAIVVIGTDFSFNF